MKKKAVIILTTAALVLSLAGCASGQNGGKNPSGAEMSSQESAAPNAPDAKELKDFSVKTVSGETFTLSEALKEKKAVLINLWATWCGPCESEFPYLEEAYEKYKDDVEVIALSVEKEDTDDVLKEYAQKHGLTFHVASDSSVGLGNTYAQESIPVTLIIDRFGKVAYYGEGAQTSTESFTKLFDQLIGDDYTETRVLKDVSIVKTPDAEKLDSKTLSSVLNAEGSTLVFENSDDTSVWSMAVREDGERTALASTNKGVAESKSEVKTMVKANKGDVLAFDFRISSEATADVLEVAVDGKTIKTFSGEYDWTTWGLELAEGQHEIVFRYDKPYDTEYGDDEALIDNIKIVSGSDAKKILDGLPKYPTADQVTVTVTNPDARQIVFEIDNEPVDDLGYSCTSYWIVPSDTADIKFTLTDDIDPGAAFGYDMSTALYFPATMLKTEGNAYVSQTAVDSVDKTGGHSFTAYYVFPRDESKLEETEDAVGAMLFRDEKNVEKFVEEMANEEGVDGLKWHYADEK